MESYRISHWTELPGSVSRLPVRKALIAMSVGWVSRAWLCHEARLNPREIDSLLDMLATQGALLRGLAPPLVETTATGTAGAGRRMMRRLSRRIVDAARVSLARRRSARA